MRVTEKKKVHIDRNCRRNPVYIRWIGTTGGWNYWLFSVKQTQLFETTTKGVFERVIEDLSKATSYRRVIGKKATPSLIVGADNVKQIHVYGNSEKQRGLYSMTLSPKIEVLIDIDANKWMEVQLADETFEVLETNTELANVEFELIMPELISQSN